MAHDARAAARQHVTAELRTTQERLPGWSLWCNDDMTFGGRHTSGYKLGPCASADDLCAEAERLHGLLEELSAHQWRIFHHATDDTWTATHQAHGSIDTDSLADLAFRAFLCRSDEQAPDLPHDLRRAFWLEGWTYRGMEQGRYRLENADGDTWEPSYADLCSVYDWYEGDADPAPQEPAAAVGSQMDAAQAAYDRDEWYTPAALIASARAVLGTIDLDPASSEAAQTVVQATQWFDREQDGVQQDWHGSVWLNPPYSAPLISPFIDTALREWDAGRVTQMLILVNDQTDAAWYQTLLRQAAAVCHLARRVAFWHPQRAGETPRQGQTVFYFGGDEARFAEVFAPQGTLMIRPLVRVADLTLTVGEIRNIWRVLNGQSLFQRQARESWRRAAREVGVDTGHEEEHAA
jgi:phage N-6-adenine-methyltransferase